MRRVRHLLAAIALSTPILGLAPATAHAAVGDLECTDTESVTYSPGLTNTAQTEDITVDNNQACTSSDPTLTSGYVHATIDGASRSCTDLFDSTTGHYTISWNNGNSSTISYSRTADYVLGTLIITEDGTVTAGEFTGDTSTHIVELADLDLIACDSSPGITSTSGEGTYVFS